MRFVETRVFAAAIRRHLDDEHDRHLQIVPMLRPEQVPGLHPTGAVQSSAPAGESCR